MGYLFMFLAGIIAGIGYAWFQNRSIWDNVGVGCFHGCLVAFGALVALVTTIVITALRLSYWTHIGVLFASFYGMFFLVCLGEYIEECRKKRDEEDDSS